MRHFLEPGLHMPPHMPFVQMKGQAIPFVHAVPAALHVCGTLVPVKHCFAPGLQMPPHVPCPWQTFGQTMLSTHAPELLQIWTVVLLLLQRRVPGLHMPPQAGLVPGTQTLGHATPFQFPMASHVSSVLPVHRV